MSLREMIDISQYATIAKRFPYLPQPEEFRVEDNFWIDVFPDGTFGLTYLERPEILRSFSIENNCTTAYRIHVRCRPFAARTDGCT